MASLDYGPRVSVIVPVYDVEEYIETCIKSLVGQTFSSFELLLIDDCSNDNSINIAVNILSAQNRIKWQLLRHEKNMGLSEARNTGIRFSKGEYIVFVDSDDWVPGNMLESLCSAAAAHPDCIICGNTTAVTDGVFEPYWFEVDEQMVFSREEGIKRMLSYNMLLDTAWAKMIPRRFFTDNGILFPPDRYFEDTPTNLRLFNMATNIVAIPQQVYFYRRNRPGSILQQRSWKTAQDRLAVFEDIYEVLCSYNYLEEDFTVRYYLDRLVGEYRNTFKEYQLTLQQQQQLAKTITEKILKLRHRHKSAKLRRLIGIKFNLLLKRDWYRHTAFFLLLHNKAYSFIEFIIDCYIF